MISKSTFGKIKSKYGKVSSFAIWARQQEGEGPKGHIDDLSPLDVQSNPDVLKKLHCDVVFVGLNPSRALQEKADFANFHDENPKGTDYVLRRLLVGTVFEGAFMTDFIPDFVNVDAQNAIKRIKDNRDYYVECMEDFLSKMDVITEGCGNKPVLVAMGKDVEKLLRDSYCENCDHDLTKKGYTVMEISHYAAAVSMEQRRQELEEVIKVWLSRKITTKTGSLLDNGLAEGMALFIPEGLTEFRAYARKFFERECGKKTTGECILSKTIAGGKLRCLLWIDNAIRTIYDVDDMKKQVWEVLDTFASQGIRTVAMNGIRCDDRPDLSFRPEKYQRQFVGEYLSTYPDVFDQIILVDARGGFDKKE